MERHYYEVRVAAPKLQTMTLAERAAMCAFTGRELLVKANVTPYDAFAIWMHLTRAVYLSKAAPGIPGMCGTAALSFAGDSEAERLT